MTDECIAGQGQNRPDVTDAGSTDNGFRIAGAEVRRAGIGKFVLPGSRAIDSPTFRYPFTDRRTPPGLGERVTGSQSHYAVKVDLRRPR
jgi:hypothetical protein